MYLLLLLWLSIGHILLWQTAPLLLLRLFWEREAERKTDGEKWPFLDMQIHLPPFLPADGLIDDWEISEKLEFWLWEPACCGLVVTGLYLKR